MIRWSMDSLFGCRRRIETKISVLLWWFGEKSFTSELFKDTLEAISLIQRYRTMWWLGSGIFHYIYHIGCAFNLHSIINNGLYLEVKIWAEDRQYSSCPLIQETKVTKILNLLTSLYHVERDTCTVHGRSIKTRYFGLILILRSEKD